MEGFCFSRNLLDTIPSKKRGYKDENLPTKLLCFYLNK